MCPVATDGVVWSVSWSVTNMSPAKMPDPIVLQFSLLTWMGRRNTVLDGGPDGPMQRGSFEGGGHPVVKYSNTVP